jgi:hypothetical protein
LVARVESTTGSETEAAQRVFQSPATQGALASRAFRSFGEFDGPDALLFGKIVDAVPVGPGQVALLDSRYGRIVLLDVAHNRSSLAAAPGIGPGELSIPVAADRLATGELVVLDRSPRLQFFTPSDVSFTYSGGVRLGYAADDMCVLDDRLYVLEPGHSEALVHPLHRDGTPAAEPFGEKYHWGGSVGEKILSRGRLICDAASRTIAVVFSILGEIHAYREDGSVRFVHRLRPFLPVLAKSSATEERFFNGLGPERPEAHVLVRAMSVRGSLVTQFALEGIDGDAGGRVTHRVDTYVVDAITGKGGLADVGEGDGVLLAVMSGGLLTYVEEPWPSARYIEQAGS